MPSPRWPTMIFQPGIGLAHAAEHQPHGLRGGLHREAPASVEDRRERLDVLLVVALHHGRIGRRQMHVDRHVERRGALEDRPEVLLVEKRPWLSPWIMAPLKPSRVTHRSSSAADALGSAVGSTAKPAKRVGGTAQAVQAIVDDARHLDRDAGVEPPRRRRVVRQHLDVDAGLVHLLDAGVGQVLQARSERRRRPGRAPPGKCLVSSGST